MLTANPTSPTDARALEIPAVIAGSVNLMRFSAALASAGIVGRFEPAWPPSQFLHPNLRPA